MPPRIVRVTTASNASSEIPDGAAYVTTTIMYNANKIKKYFIIFFTAFGP